MNQPAAAPAPAARSSDLRTRAVSGAVMMIVALGCLWAGGIAFRLLASAVAVVMMAEWAGLMHATRWKRILSILFALGLVVGLGEIAVTPKYWLGGYASALLPVLVLAGASAALLALLTLDWRLGAGLLYAVLPALALLWFSTFGPFHSHDGGWEAWLHAGMMILGGLLLAAAHLTNMRLTHLSAAESG